MSIVDITKMWSKDGGSISSEKADPFDRQFAFTEGYQVLLDNDHDPDYVAEQGGAFGLPQINTQHVSGKNAFVKRINPQRIGPRFYIVDVAYEGIESNDAVVDVEWSDVTTSEEIDRDWDGRAILTANGEQVKGLSIDVADQICVIRRKFYSINTAAIRAYRRATNSDTFLGWPPGTARLVGFSAKNQFKYGAAQELWDVTARFQFREPYANTTAAQAWDKRWRHEGLLVNKYGIIQRATDTLQQERTTPVLLKLNGEEETNADSAVFVHTRVYGSLAFSSLGLV